MKFTFLDIAVADSKGLTQTSFAVKVVENEGCGSYPYPGDLKGSYGAKSRPAPRGAR